MTELSNEQALWHWFGEHFLQLGISFLVLILYVAVDRISAPRLEESAASSRLKSDSARKAIQVARGIIGLFGLLLLVVIWGVDFNSVAILATTAITLLGVALFAPWSLLSNRTAYFILLLHPSLKRGCFVRILDADNYVEGTISELTLFNVKLVSENRELVVYPNNLILGRPVIVNPRDRLAGVGKLMPSQNSTEPEHSRSRKPQ